MRAQGRATVFVTGTLKRAVPFFVQEPLTAITAAAADEGAEPRRVWLWLNLVSLDAPVVAVLWQTLLDKCIHAAPAALPSAALALSVWFIYVSDRLLDALRIRSGVTSPRHRFYRRHWRAFIAAAMASLFALGWLCGRLSPELLCSGSVLLGAVVIYFLSVHAARPPLRKRLPKEFVVGFLFSIGTCLPAWADKPGDSLELVAPALLFAFLCALNCIAIEYWEWYAYQPANGAPPHRFTVWVGNHLAMSCVSLMLFSILGYIASSASGHPFYLASLVSSAGLFYLAWQNDRIRTEALRVLADAVLLTPAITLAIQAVR